MSLLDNGPFPECDGEECSMDALSRKQTLRARFCYHLSCVWIWLRAEVMPPLCSWEQELWTVLCCTSLEKDRGISVPRILVLLLLSSDPRLTQHGCMCSVARWYSIAATQSSEAFRLLRCPCHTLVQGAGFTAYLLSHLCVL